MFTALSFILCLLAALWIAAAQRRSPGPLESALVTKLPQPHRAARLIGLALGLAVALLFATGFGSVWLVGHVGGLALLLHAGAGGLLAVAAALYVPLHAETQTRPHCTGRTWFWLAALATALALASVLLMMTKMAGTAGQERLLALHGWSALAAVLGWALHGHHALLRQRARRAASPLARPAAGAGSPSTHEQGVA